LLTAGKLFALLLKRTLGETESFEDALDAVVKVVGVVMLKLVLDVLEAMFQPLALRLVGFGGDGVGDFFGMAGQISDIRQGRGGFVPNGAAELEFRVLLQVSERGRRMQVDAALVG